jgi:hypothetical protein
MPNMQSVTIRIFGTDENWKDVGNTSIKFDIPPSKCIAEIESQLYRLSPVIMETFINYISKLEVLEKEKVNHGSA